MEIRLFTKNDSPKVKKLFGGSVKLLNAGEDSASKIQYWTPDCTHFRDWEHRFLSDFTIVAETDSAIVGLGQLGKSGHINLFYTHPDYRHQGIGREIYSTIEGYAFSRELPILFTEATQDTYGFFFNLGFEHVSKQQVLVGGREITSFVMQKSVPDSVS